jgi:hypothetical protein
MSYDSDAMTAGQIVEATYRVAHALYALKSTRHLIDEATYRTVDGNLRHAQETVALIGHAPELPTGRQAEALAAIRQHIDEDTEASLLGTNELKWASAGRLAFRPRLAARLALALWAEARHGWHRLTGTYDTAVFTGTRLAPVQPGEDNQQQG